MENTPMLNKGSKLCVMTYQIELTMGLLPMSMIDHGE